MHLKSKIVFTLLFVVVLFTAADYGIHRLVIFPSYVALERAEAQKDLERCVEALRDEIRHLDLFTNDWATWDDTYRFVQDRNNEYIVSNLGLQTFLDNDLNLIYFCNTKGEVIWGEIRNLESGQRLQLPEFPSQGLPQGHRLLEHQTVDSAVAGIYATVPGAAHDRGQTDNNQRAEGTGAGKPRHGTVHS
ncbi:MAG: hypothetical protein JSW39_01990 [Desulfobacterales bacterium]|nr:MAG: hypothetical protein JSW39_01990 [Desulfobacterales bacterium]